jgi:hypothetical protein
MNYNEMENGSGLMDFIKKGFKTVKTMINGRNDYPPAERKIISDEGERIIKEIIVYREPLESKVNALVNLISSGKFDEVKKKYGYDEMYHLFMVVKLDNDVRILIEKNEVINIHLNPSIKVTAQSMPVALNNKKISFKQFLDNGQNYMGDKYFKYDAFTNNCQNYISSLLKSNGLDNPTVNSFVVQDLGGLTRDMGKTNSDIFRGITDLAAKFNILAKGAGFNGSKHKRNIT